MRPPPFASESGRNRSFESGGERIGSAGAVRERFGFEGRLRGGRNSWAGSKSATGLCLQVDRQIVSRERRSGRAGQWSMPDRPAVQRHSGAAASR